ncbi:MAG: ferredoxin [archaeon GW2011_AR17]|nr:MAG: ferredoxin [archaeon GW2011_AR17]MBS3154448.1 ferredoxin [Candidatus Woesearchaeota archaeon]HIH15694.1 ferredoxin [Nanoarchaeota archaeon]HIH59349.1 ferredoxin [Nanoarchaeota archaeon]HII13573.1 ferredoxin [Nanoarchaeota archaeon]
MSTIIHFRDKCIGCNSCIEIAPEFWEMSKEDGKSKLKDSIDKKGIYQKKIHKIDLDKNKEATESCPVNCIQVID